MVLQRNVCAEECFRPPVYLEVDIHHDTGFLDEPNDVAPDQYVGAIRRWRRKHMLDLSGAGLNSLLRRALRATPAASTGLRTPEAWSTSRMDLAAKRLDHFYFVSSSGPKLAKHLKRRQSSTAVQSFLCGRERTLAVL
jgi:hypothetical protein